jgi:phage shock protein A
MANIFARFWNFSTGWLHSSQSRLESSRPDIVYDQALKAENAKYKNMEEAVSGLVYNRNRLDGDIEDGRSKLEEVQSMLDQAVEDAQGEDKAAAEEAMTIGAMLQEQEESLLERIVELTQSRDAAAARIDEYQGKLVEFQAKVSRLKEEKSTVVAQAQVDRETIRLNRELSGMTIDDDSQSLNELREKMGRLHAQANMTEEMTGNSLQERTRQYQLKAKSTTAQKKFLDRVESAKAVTGDTARPQLSGDASASDDA